MTTVSRKTRVWGVWEPVPEQVPAPGEPFARPLEWWPSRRAAEASLRNRIQINRGSINTDTERRADGTVRTDAQFYAGHRSAVFLYRVQGEPGADPRPEERPYAVLEFGPRGGVRQRALIDSKD